MRRSLRFAHLVVFAAFVVAWTVALLSPVPGESERMLGGPRGVYLFSSGVHIAANAFLAVLGGTIALFGRRWIWVIPALAAHSGVIEYMQQFVGRTASLLDFTLNLVGLAIGGVIALGWRRIRTARAPAATTSSPAVAAIAAPCPPSPLPSTPPSPTMSLGNR